MAVLPKTSLQAALFEEITGESQPSLMVCSAAHEKRGKTHWGMTMPDPIAVVSSDTGTREVAAKWKRDGKKIHYFEFEVQRKGPDAAAHAKLWDDVEAAIRTVIRDTKVRSLLVDTGTEVWEQLRLARFGKLTQVMPHHYGPVNAEFRELLKAVQKRPGLNSVWIHKVKKEYKTNREGKDSWSGKYERAGFTDFPFVADVIVEHYFDTDEREFGTRIIDSRYEPMTINGMELTGTLNNFASLGQLCFPETDEDYWR